MSGLVCVAPSLPPGDPLPAPDPRPTSLLSGAQSLQDPSRRVLQTDSRGSGRTGNTCMQQSSGVGPECRGSGPDGVPTHIKDFQDSFTAGKQGSSKQRRGRQARSWHLEGLCYTKTRLVIAFAITDLACSYPRTRRPTAPCLHRPGVGSGKESSVPGPSSQGVWGGGIKTLKNSNEQKYKTLFSPLHKDSPQSPKVILQGKAKASVGRSGPSRPLPPSQCLVGDVNLTDPHASPTMGQSQNKNSAPQGRGQMCPGVGHW